VLALDATLNCKLEDGPKPGDLTHHEIEEIEGILKEKRFPILDQDLLIVAAHYPLNDYSELGPIEGLDKRLWRGGMTLARQIARYRGRDCAPTVWLSGDIHVDLNHYNRGIYHVTTGHMGGAKIYVDNIQRHEVTLLSIDSEPGRSTVTKFQFNPKGYTFDAFTGVWERLETHPLGGETTPPLQNPSTSVRPIQTVSSPALANAGPCSRVPVELLEDSAKMNATAEAISLQENILRTI
jgi:hypothetical protein